MPAMPLLPAMPSGVDLFLVIDGALDGGGIGTVDEQARQFCGRDPPRSVLQAVGFPVMPHAVIELGLAIESAQEILHGDDAMRFGIAVEGDLMTVAVMDGGHRREGALDPFHHV